MRDVVRRTFFQGEVTHGNLGQMTSDELEAGCELLGIPKCGTVDEKRERIVAAWTLRQYIKDWSDDVKEREALAKAHTGKQLKVMCKRWRIYCNGNKYGMISGLIGWRNNCRMKGQQVLKSAMKGAKLNRQKHGYQLDMFRDGVNITPKEYEV